MTRTIASAAFTASVFLSMVIGSKFGSSTNSIEFVALLAAFTVSVGAAHRFIVACGVEEDKVRVGAFVLSTVVAGLIIMHIALGETSGRFPRRIDRMQHTLLLFLPAVIALQALVWAKLKKKNDSEKTT